MWRSPEKVWDARDVSPPPTPSRAPRRLGPASRSRDSDLRRISSVCRFHTSSSTRSTTCPFWEPVTRE
ncbi:unnamed protein product, partial [Musa acuminata subsp. burmannicoides]